MVVSKRVAHHRRTSSARRRWCFAQIRGHHRAACSDPMARAAARSVIPAASRRPGWGGAPSAN